MHLNPIRENMTEVFMDGPGYKAWVLFSYQTPVALRHATPTRNDYYVTEKQWSKTTTHHINEWLLGGDIKATKKPQKWFDTLIRAELT